MKWKISNLFSRKEIKQNQEIEKKYLADFTREDYNFLFVDKSTTIIVHNEKTKIDIDLSQKNLKNDLDK
ncbi:hypothetical protein [[Mycoplasma] mobile]|nr:hypothetical protein [[Mycoplasma] mobile]